MQLFHLTRSAVIQIAKTVQTVIKIEKRLLETDMPVLGLAGCHVTKLEIIAGK